MEKLTKNSVSTLTFNRELTFKLKKNPQLILKLLINKQQHQRRGLLCDRFSFRFRRMLESSEYNGFHLNGCTLGFVHRLES